jgi:hypothetical protein
MKKVKISTTFPSWPLEGQTPGSSCMWDNFKFFINRDVSECDFWVVYEGLPDEEASRCCPRNTILILGEPPSIKTYKRKFLSQFYVVLGCDPTINHSNVINSQQALPWHVGVTQKSNGAVIRNHNYDHFNSINKFQKIKDLSIICSSKSYTEVHKQRIRFVERLKSHFGDNIDIYGRGFNAIADKWDAIYPYKYHIVLENCSIPNYWTEKLSDSYLGGAYPIYYGCTNLNDYFPDKSFQPIDISDPDQAIAMIEEVINKNLYEYNVGLIDEARFLVLNKYNLFPMIVKLCNTMAVGSAKCIRLKPETSFTNSPSTFHKAVEYSRGIIQQIFNH